MIPLSKLRKADIRAELAAMVHAVERAVAGSYWTARMRLTAALYGVECGQGVRFNGYTRLERFKHSTIRIGRNCTFNSLTLFNGRGVSHPCVLQTRTDQASITIGDCCGFSGVSIVADTEVSIGQGVMIGTDTLIGDTDGHQDRLCTDSRPIRIDDGVFIGMHCIILKGVHIGAGCVIGAGSVVTHDIPAGSVAAGVPCRVVKKKDNPPSGE